MFVDASAIIAILRQEEGWEGLSRALEQAGTVYVSALSRWEAVVGLARKLSTDSATIQAAVDEFLENLDARGVDIGAEIGKTAEAAWFEYGKGSRHPAALNFGDCFAYACAKACGVPLLYKGDGFSRTDLA